MSPQPASPYDSMDDEDLLAAIAENRDAIRAAKEARDSAYAARLEMFLAARRREPPILNDRIATAAGVSDVAVINSIREAERKAEQQQADS